MKHAAKKMWALIWPHKYIFQLVSLLFDIAELLSLFCILLSWGGGTHSGIYDAIFFNWQQQHRFKIIQYRKLAVLEFLRISGISDYLVVFLTNKTVSTESELNFYSCYLLMASACLILEASCAYILHVKLVSTDRPVCCSYDSWIWLRLLRRIKSNWVICNPKELVSQPL